VTKRKSARNKVAVNKVADVNKAEVNKEAVSKADDKLCRELTKRGGAPPAAFFFACLAAKIITPNFFGGLIRVVGR
jgi:hypothetical protein